MMRGFTLLFLLCAPAAWAGELPSRPLFTPGVALNATTAPQPGTKTYETTTGISSFMYFGPEQWSFWWRGQRVTPGALPAGMTNLEVGPGAVRFSHSGTDHQFVLGKFN